MYNVHVYTWGCFVAWLKVALHGPVYHTVFSHSVHTCHMYMYMYIMRTVLASDV